MTEELRSGQLFGDGATVDGDERLSGTLAELMDAVGYILFTRSAGTMISTDIVVGATSLT